jgi:hypothetical protein
MPADSGTSGTSDRSKGLPAQVLVWIVLLGLGFLADKACFTDVSGQQTVGYRINLNDIFVAIAVGFGFVAVLLYQIRELLREILHSRRRE